MNELELLRDEDRWEANWYADQAWGMPEYRRDPFDHMPFQDFAGNGVGGPGGLTASPGVSQKLPATAAGTPGGTHPRAASEKDEA